MTGLILASGSPRRRAFLTGAGVPHVVRPTGVDERIRAGEQALPYARRLAAEKAEAAWAARAPGEPRWVLAADTVVAADGQILDKPADGAAAVAALTALSGRTHQVHTAWALRGPDGLAEHAVETADVRFRALEAAEVVAYVATGDPLDKAGAYGIQGPAGRFVEAVHGSYPAVVGLPIEEVLGALVAHGAVEQLDPVALRVRAVRGRIAAAASGNGLPPDAIRLVGVSKRQPLDRIRAGVAAGLSDLGENYVQAWREKVDRLPQALRWHFIGHLQRNKARLLDERVVLVHGVDSVRTAEALAKVGRAQGREVRYLAQVNVGEEGSKAGLPPDGLPAFLDAVQALEGARLEGLMTIPPPAAQAGARRWFAALRDLRDAHATPARPLRTLSMGMSGDYEAAIAEGATHVRVGSALFGAREA